MKYIITLLIILNSIANVKAQTTSDIGKISFAVVMPESLEGLSTSQLSHLESKIAKIVTTAGIAATGYSSNFAIYPKITVTNDDVIEGGMQNIYMISAEVSLFIKQLDNNLLYSSLSIPIKGSGSTKANALANAISKISTDNTAYYEFINNSKSKIVKYYESKCPDIINRAQTEAELQNYDLAISILMGVPQEITSCYASAQQKAINIYKDYQNKLCTEILHKAKVALASKNYLGTLNIIATIDPASSCYNEATTLAKETETKITIEEKKEWQFKQRQYNDAINLEKQRINAIKDIAVAYYKRTPPNINYNIIVR